MRNQEVDGHAGKSITDIVRERWETGAYGSGRFVMARSTLSRLRPLTPAPAFRPHSGGLRDLLSIPIVIDEAIPDGAWRLVDGVTGRVLFEGRHAEEATPMDD